MKSISSILKIFLISKWTGALKFKKVSQNKTCVILGNGPSLVNSLHQYQNILNSHDVLCVNNFVLTEKYLEIRPKFYILNAKSYFVDESKTSSFYLEMRKNVFNAFLKKTDWEIFIMVPFVARKSSEFRELLKLNKNINALYYNLTPVEGLTSVSNFLMNLKLGMPRPHNVIIPALVNLIQIKYNKIYILGADHSWLNDISVDEKNNALVNQKHFYDMEISKPEKMVDYITRPRRLHEILHKFYLTFRGYWDVQEYAKSQNVKIFNATEESMIDAFERKKVE